MRAGLSDDEIARAVERSNPDLIGISVQFSCQLNAALHISSLVRKILPDVITVAGGSHVSVHPPQLPAAHSTGLYLVRASSGC